MRRVGITAFPALALASVPGFCRVSLQAPQIADQNAPSKITVTTQGIVMQR